jgi:hypothetical protein
VHDLGRALEDAVDAQVAQELLGSDWPLPPRSWTSSSATSQAISEAYSLVRAASMRMSLRLSSASALASSSIDSIP